MQHPAVTDEILELASMFAAGALSPEQEKEFQEHLHGCALCAEEARTFQEAASQISLASGGMAAPARVRDKLIARIRESAPAPEVRIMRAVEGSWREMIPGVVAKRLWADPAGGNTAMLLRMEAGAQFPPHWHADIEHCYVLEGDLRFGDLKLEPGDYQCAMAATTHITSHTEQGCMVLIVASQQNQILPWTR